MNIIARISTCLGIGHVMRMKWLLHEFSSRGYSLSVILDDGPVDVSYLIKELECELHYVITNSANDIALIKSLIVESKPCFVFIDHYELGYEYEVQLNALGCKVAVFDDLAREHYCDFLFDAKWEGHKTANRYDNKVPDFTKLYQGPDFALLSPDYSNCKRKVITNKGISKILLCLGGGGDLALFASFIRAIPAALMKELNISVVIGPQAKNRASLDLISKDIPEITLLEAPLSLAKYYSECDLFIGSLGTSLYELAAFKVPSITFSIAVNQNNELSHLEAFGHFLHLDMIDLAQMKMLGENLAKILCALPRITQLRKQAILLVDGAGVKRVVNALTGEQQGSGGDFIKSHVHAYTYLSETISIRPICDEDINDYLVARNKPSNAKRMTLTKSIERLPHYLWWFNNERQSYVVEKNGKAIAYIWHQLYRQNGAEYLYGGWFTADEELPFSIAILILQWQLDSCDELYPHAHWLAVIHKDNKFVNLLNRYMGFAETPQDSLFYSVTEGLFPQADKQFNFVMRYPNE